jgi:hypothetical protein
MHSAELRAMALAMKHLAAVPQMMAWIFHRGNNPMTTQEVYRLHLTTEQMAYEPI